MTLKIELIAIGNEVLSGTTVNSNAAHISRSLSESGFKVTSHIAIPDEPKILKTKLNASIQDNDIIIATGGLGPTCDDNTRQAIAEVFASKLILNSTIEQELIKRYPNKNIASSDQATIPDKAKPLPNPIGTAPGLYLTKNNCHVFFLPGVPLEMEYILENSVLPILNNNFTDKSTEFISKLYFFQVSESEADPILRELKANHAEIDFGIYPNLGITTIHVISDFKSEKDNIEYQKPILDKLKASFGNRYFSNITNRLQDLLADKLNGKTISIAQTVIGCQFTKELNTASPSINISCSILAKPDYLSEKFALDSTDSKSFAKQLASKIKHEHKADIGIVLSNIDESKAIQNNQPDGLITFDIDNKIQQFELVLWGNLETVYKRLIHFTFAKLYLNIS